MIETVCMCQNTSIECNKPQTQEIYRNLNEQTQHHPGDHVQQDPVAEPHFVGFLVAVEIVASSSTADTAREENEKASQALNTENTTHESQTTKRQGSP